MSIEQLDRIFPYICFAYGALMTLAMNSAWLVRIADERLPEPFQSRWRANRGLALVCLLVGAAWILQNLWLL
jgi:cytochrome bd-type quinol oxidase subunit 2